jgi:hypothetical protein
LFKTQEVDIISIDIKEIKITIIVKKFSIEEIKPTDFFMFSKIVILAL